MDEIFQRAKKVGVAFNHDVAIAQSLFEEVEAFINKTFVPPSVSIKELSYNSNSVCRSLDI